MQYVFVPVTGYQYTGVPVRYRPGVESWRQESDPRDGEPSTVLGCNTDLEQCAGLSELASLASERGVTCEEQSSDSESVACEAAVFSSGYQ